MRDGKAFIQFRPMDSKIKLFAKVRIHRVDVGRRMFPLSNQSPTVHLRNHRLVGVLFVREPAVIKKRARPTLPLHRRRYLSSLTGNSNRRSGRTKRD